MHVKPKLRKAQTSAAAKILGKINEKIHSPGGNCKSSWSRYEDMGKQAGESQFLGIHPTFDYSVRTQTVKRKLWLMYTSSLATSFRSALPIQTGVTTLQR